jgi:hypothetical protein
MQNWVFCTMPLMALSEKAVGLAAKEALAEHVIEEYGFCARKACKTVQIDCEKWSYTSFRTRSDENW